MAYIYSILFFINLVVIILLIFYRIKKKQIVDERLNTQFKVGNTISKTKKTPVKKVFLKLLNNFNISKKLKKSIEINLMKANMKISVEEYIIVKILLVIIILISFLFLKKIILAFVFSILFWILPSFFLKFRYKKRLKKFNNQLNDGIRILSNGLKAGYSYMQAMQTLTKEMNDPISMEFERLLKEISLGIDTKKALRNLDERIGSEDLTLVIRAMIIQQETGGNLAEILDNISDTIRKRIKIQREIKTLTAQGKMSGIVIGVMPIIIVFFLFILNPEYADVLINTKIGNLLIGISIISEIIGIIIIRKIISIKF